MYPFRPPRRAVPGRIARRALAGASALLALGCAPAERGDPASQGLVFVRQGAGSTDLWRARIADAAERPVTRTSERQERWPYWSPQSARLLFQASRPGEPNDLYLWDPENDRETPLMQTPERDERWQRWSPDGEQVVYAFRGGEPAAGVAVVGAADGRVQVLARAGEGEFFLRPRFGPDGARVLVQHRRAGRPGSALWLLAPGAEPRSLVSDDGWFAFKGSFRPDGGRIVYTRRPTGAHPPSHQVASVDPAGGDLRILAGDDASDAHSAEPSPGRDEIAFVARTDGDYDLYLRDESGVRALTRTPDRDELAPRWSPDGALLVVTTSPTRSGRPRLTDEKSLAATGIAVVDRQGRELFTAPGFMPDWMPPWR